MIECGIYKAGERETEFLCFPQKFLKKFMKKAKKGLDIHGCVYYYIGARVWDNHALVLR